MLWAGGKELAQHRPEIANKDASDLCEKGLLRAMVKLRQCLLHHLKLGFIFPLGNSSELLPNSNGICHFTASSFQTSSASPVRNMGSLLWKMSLLSGWLPWVCPDFWVQTTAPLPLIKTVTALRGFTTDLVPENRVEESLKSFLYFPEPLFCNI